MRWVVNWIYLVDGRQTGMGACSSWSLFFMTSGNLGSVPAASSLAVGSRRKKNRDLL